MNSFFIHWLNIHFNFTIYFIINAFNGRILWFNYDLTKYTVPFIDLLFVYDMLRAYILIICNPEVRYEIANIIEKLDNVVNVDIINGPYDLVVEIIFDTMDDLKAKIQHDINNIDRLMSTLTLIRSEDVWYNK